MSTLLSNVSVFRQEVDACREAEAGGVARLYLGALSGAQTVSYSLRRWLVAFDVSSCALNALSYTEYSSTLTSTGVEIYTGVGDSVIYVCRRHRLRPFSVFGRRLFMIVPFARAGVFSRNFHLDSVALWPLLQKNTRRRAVNYH